MKFDNFIRDIWIICTTHISLRKNLHLLFIPEQRDPLRARIDRIRGLGSSDSRDKARYGGREPEVGDDHGSAATHEKTDQQEPEGRHVVEDSWECVRGLLLLLAQHLLYLIPRGLCDLVVTIRAGVR